MSDSALLSDSANTTDTITPTDSVTSDSLSIEMYKDSLLNLEHERIRLHENHKYSDTPFNPYHASLSEIFSSDGTAPSEFLYHNPLFTSARFGLSSSINRSLYYGNTAPINRISTGNLLYSANYHLFSGTDLYSSTFISNMYTDNRGLIMFNTFPDNFTVPEAVAFWENGVFGEDILNLRFSRMLSRQLMVSVFSTYRHFKGKKFSHNRQNIYNFYNSIFDSSTVMNNGYNPLTDEHTVGVSAAWKGNNGNKIDLNFLYGDLSNEIALDRTSKIDEIPHALVNRYPLFIETNTSWKLPGKFFLDLDGAYKNEPVVYTSPELIEQKTTPIRKDGLVKDIEAAARSGHLFNDDSLGIKIELKRNKKEFFDSSSFLGWQNRYELFYSPNFTLGNIEIMPDLGAGCAFNYWEKSLTPVPVWHAALKLKKHNHKIRAFVEYDYIPFPVSLDSISLNQVLADQYFKAGAEYLINWNIFGLLLGYQFVHDIDPISVINSWPSGSIPFEQPQSVFIIAPRLSWNGLKFGTSAMLSDSKPFIKSHTELSYAAHPAHTHEYIDMKLSLDYWSERDTIYFAGFDDWNNPVCNLSFEIAAHIKSFRLFYKIDNLLNFKYAYVPGYYSSGLTFRWGFNWFIQK